MIGRIGFGAANLGNLYSEMSDQASLELLEAAWDSGIRYFDTAPHYGLGLSERRLGAFLQTKPRDEFVISTKVGRLLRPSSNPGVENDLAHNFAVPAELERIWDPSAAGIRASLAESLERLGLDRVDILFLHDPEQNDLESSLAAALPALAELREAGTVSHIGVGSMSTQALLTAARSGLPDILMVAGRYTLAEQTGIHELRQVCERNSVEMVTASVFNSGLLATRTPSADARYDYARVPAETLEHVVGIAQVCERYGIELPTAALQYTLQDPIVRWEVLGTGSATQLRENIARIHTPIPDELWDELRTRRLVAL